MVLVHSFLGMSLPTAGVFIGWFNVFICDIECLIFVLVYLDVPYIAEKLVRRSKQQREIAVENMKLFSYLVLGVFITFVLIDLVTSITLIIGIERNQRYMLIPWLFTTSLSIVMQLASIFCLCTGLMLSNKHRDMKLILIVFNTTITGLHIWMWMVIFSLHVHIRIVVKND